MPLQSPVRTRAGKWSIGLGVVIALAVHTVGAVPSPAQTPRTVTPAPPTCATAHATPSETGGPHYKRDSPERTSLLDPGAYSLETILPGLYPGRTRHIHVKVRVPNGPVLTTQLYFPREQRNQTDAIFDPALVVAMQDLPDGQVALFNFVVSVR